MGPYTLHDITDALAVSAIMWVGNCSLPYGGSGSLRQRLDVGTAKLSGETSDQQRTWKWQCFVLSNVGSW